LDFRFEAISLGTLPLKKNGFYRAKNIRDGDAPGLKRFISGYYINDND
jgi:hypothetical protein